MFFGKIFEASQINSAAQSYSVGPELRRLRILAGLTQKQIALRMDIQQSAVSRIEQGGEVYLSSVQKYVEALGASLRLNAHIPTNAPLAIGLREVFDHEHDDENQLVLPILGDDTFKPQRDIVLSIKPCYSTKILEGKKTVELRRRFPTLAPRGTLAFIYSTSPVKAMVGTASIKNVLKLPINQMWKEFQGPASITKNEFDRYFDGLDYGFALFFDRVRTFSRPLPLLELRKKFGFEPPQSFLYAKRDLRRALENEPAIVSD
jgi:predicted transcriptional regulator/DNA-binding XRE family transcriptional regulator